MSASPIQLDGVALTLPATGKVEAIDGLIEMVRGLPVVKDAGILREAVLAREAEAPTWLGYEVAMPHARTKSVNRLVLAAGRLEKPLPWAGADKPVRHIILIGVPPDSIEVYLQTVKRLVHAIKRTDLLARLTGASSPDEYRQAWSAIE